MDNAQVITHEICNKFIEIKFSVGSRLSRKYGLSVIASVPTSTTSKTINKIQKQHAISSLYRHFFVLFLKHLIFTAKSVYLWQNLKACFFVVVARYIKHIYESKDYVSPLVNTYKFQFVQMIYFILGQLAVCIT